MFKEIRPLWALFFLAGGRTDGQYDEANEQFSQIRNHA